MEDKENQKDDNEQEVSSQNESSSPQNKVRLLHPILGDEKDNSLPSLKKISLYFLLILAAGVLSGFLVSSAQTLVSKSKNGNQGTGTTSKKAKEVVGIKDKETFKDSAEGVLRKGGIDGEGQFHLERPGGESQNVYLTSTTVDLSQYVGQNVRVWGETFAAQKAGWLMDVGLVEVL